MNRHNIGNTELNLTYKGFNRLGVVIHRRLATTGTAIFYKYLTYSFSISVGPPFKLSCSVTVLPDVHDNRNGFMFHFFQFIYFISNISSYSSWDEKLIKNKLKQLLIALK